MHTLQLAARHLSKAYGYFWALKDVNLNIAAGECVALLGPNGAGKTTLLKLLAGLIYPTSGEIQINGTALSQTSTTHPSTLGLLPPGEHHYHNLTVCHNLTW